MSVVVRFPDQSDAGEQAAQWIVRLDRGLSRPEQDELQKWLAASPRHRELLLRTAELWDKTGILSDIADLFPLPSTHRRHSRKRAYALAAGILAIAGIGSLRLWSGSHGPGGPDPALPSPQALTAAFGTAIGEQRRVDLPDGSILHLNTDSQIQVRFQAGRRDVELLRGEALFSVAKDPGRVFTVKVGDSEFRAVGTAFNLRMDPARGVQLTVTEGRVRVVVPATTMPADTTASAGAGLPAKAAPTEITVDAGKAVTVAATAQTVEPLRAAELEAATAWTRGMILFEAEPLGRAIQEISRYSALRFIIEDRSINDIPVSGYFRTGDIDGLIGTLEGNFPVTVQREGDAVRLRARRHR